MRQQCGGFCNFCSSYVSGDEASPSDTCMPYHRLDLDLPKSESSITELQFGFSEVTDQNQKKRLRRSKWIFTGVLFSIISGVNSTLWICQIGQVKTVKASHNVRRRTADIPSAWLDSQSSFARCLIWSRCPCYMNHPTFANHVDNRHHFIEPIWWSYLVYDNNATNGRVAQVVRASCYYQARSLWRAGIPDDNGLSRRAT